MTWPVLAMMPVRRLPAAAAVMQYAKARGPVPLIAAGRQLGGPAPTVFNDRLW